MSTSLDKLKALTNKLDDKLAEKNKISTSHIERERESIPSSVKEAIDIANATQTDGVADRESSNLNISENSDNSSLENDIRDENIPELEIGTVESRTEENKSDITVLIKSETAEDVRAKNIARVKELYDILNIYEKSPDFSKIFMYKAMNLSGIGLKDEDFGIIRKGKYIQIIAITYEPDANGKKKAKNISLGYFGKGESIDPELKNNIIEFVLCWRYEKAFQNVEHYKNLLAMIDKKLKDEIVTFK
ncbi:hypothetical protein MNB_SV-6-444 [hydrothermal vent metagenome]|uniref:Uncharacterized protein n=1 Tax=hydrothermal vent metagenome TaxID=652676 RepID=A0A1W1B8B8_9ZZZZ